MRSRVIGAPLTTIVVGPSAAVQPITDATDIYVVKGNGSQPVLLSLPPNPNDGDSFAVEDGAGNAAAVAIGIFSNAGQPGGFAPIVGPNPNQVNITTNFGGLSFTYSFFAGGWLVASYLGGGAAPGSGASTAALGNWISYFSRTGSGSGQQVPANQTNPSTTCIAALTLQATQSGIFYVTCNAEWAVSLAGEVIVSHLWAADVNPGALAGGVAAGYSGAGSTGAVVQALGVDAAGGNGITFDGNAIVSLAAVQKVCSMNDTSIAGYLSGNGTKAAQKISFAGFVGAGGNSNTKTPVATGHKLLLALTMQGTAQGGDVFTFGNVQLSAQEQVAA